MTLKFGSHLMGMKLRQFPEAAQALEANGFESIWINDHLALPTELPHTYPYSDEGAPPLPPDTPIYDPWVLHGLIAGATSSIRLATSVYILPLRHPLLVARSVTTLDRISGGRMTLGVGVGWLKDEFDYMGVPFEERGPRTDASIVTMRRLWSEEAVTVDDGYYRFGPTMFRPRPLQAGGVPIEVGGISAVALRRAGRLGDGWVATGSLDLREFEAKVAAVHETREAEDRRGPFEVTVTGPLSKDPETFEALRDAGATRVVINPFRYLPNGTDPDRLASWARQFADEVISRF